MKMDIEPTYIISIYGMVCYIVGIIMGKYIFSKKKYKQNKDILDE